jgi:putative chitinase
MTSEQLAQLGIDSKWFQPLEDTFEKYEINTPKRQAAFIGQCAHESNNFKTLEENLSYSAEGLMRTWPSRFPTLEIAQQYARNPEKIANKVYGGRAELGNTEEGDGWKFHGRGIVQLTGRSNYTVCGQALGRPFAETPELVLDPENACLSAGWFWNKKNLNSLADSGDVETMTRRINGGLIGLDDRKAKIAKALSVLSV